VNKMLTHSHQRRPTEITSLELEKVQDSISMVDLDSFRSYQFGPQQSLNIQHNLNLTSLVNQLWSNSLKMLLKQLSEFGVLAVEED